jgi:heat shock protein HslJ
MERIDDLLVEDGRRWRAAIDHAQPTYAETTERLDGPTLATPTRGRRGLVLLAVAGSVAVVLVVVLLAFSLVRGHRVMNGAGLRLTGIHWVLTEVSHNGGPPIAVPASHAADLEFDRNGNAQANDGLNTHDADFTATATTITLRNAMTTAIGHIGYDPVLDATTGSIGDLFDKGYARYTITGPVLTVDTRTWTLSFTNAGALRSPAGTPASTHT